MENTSFNPTVRMLNINDRYIANFFNENNIAKDSQKKMKNIIILTFYKIQLARTKAIDTGNLKFKVETEAFRCSDNISLALQIFKSYDIEILEKQVFNQTKFNIRWNTDSNKNLTSSIENFKQKFITQPLNQLAEVICNVMQKKEIECDDNCYNRVYDVAKKMLEKLEPNACSKEKIKGNLDPEDESLILAVADALNIKIISKKDFKVQDFCLEGKIS